MWCSPPSPRGRQGPRLWLCVPGRRRGKWNADIMVDVSQWVCMWCFLYQGHGKQTMWCTWTQDKNNFLFLNSFNKAEKEHHQSRHIPVPKSVDNSELQYQTRVSQGRTAAIFVCITVRLYPNIKLYYSRLHPLNDTFHVGNLMLQASCWYCEAYNIFYYSIEYNEHSADPLGHTVSCNGFSRSQWFPPWSWHEQRTYGCVSVYACLCIPVGISCVSVWRWGRSKFGREVRAKLSPKTKKSPYQRKTNVIGSQQLPCWR